MRTYKLLAFLLFLATTQSAFAQKCKFDTEKKDDFTNENVRSSKFKVGDFFYSWWILIEQKGPKYYMTIQSATTGKIDDIIPKGAKVMLKLDNGKIVSYTLSEDCVPNHNVINAGTSNPTITSTWLPKGELSKEDMTALSQAELVVIRMNIGGKDFDSPKPSGKEAKKIMQSAGCFLAE
jgi:hypothetical protein